MRRNAITRRAFLGRMSAAVAAGVLARAAGAAETPAPTAAAAKRPNIVFILADDLGYGDVGCYGAPDIRTPVLDGLATQGVRFTQAYAAAPECSPTRTAFLTGRYLQRVGGLECAIGVGGVGRYDDAERLAAKGELGLPVEEMSIARLLKDAGYATACIGKWHLGYDQAKFGPNRHGFDYAFGPIGGNCDYFKHTEADGLKVLYENGRQVDRDGYMTELLTDAAVRFIGDQSPAKPFFLYLPYTAPHSPYQGPKDAATAPPAEGASLAVLRGKFCEMVEAMDAGIGRVLKALDDRGHAAHTLVIFMSDNGGDARGRNAPFSGAKSSTFEGGIREPCIARWPGVLKAGTASDQPCITMDFSASILAAAGAAAAPGRPFEGIDIIRHVAEGRPALHRTLFWRYRRADRTRKAVRDGSLKLVSVADAKGAEEWLFDLAADPAEKNDLKAARPADFQRLKGLLAAWEKDVQPKR